MERYIWAHCTGTILTDPPRPTGHVGEIQIKVSEDDFVDTDIWLTKEQAQAKYPDIIVSGSSTRCPDCSAVWRAEVDRLAGSDSL